MSTIWRRMPWLLFGQSTFNFTASILSEPSHSFTYCPPLHNRQSRAWLDYCRVVGQQLTYGDGSFAMHIKPWILNVCVCDLRCAELTASGLRDCHSFLVVLSHQLASPLLGHLSDISALHTSPNLILCTVNAPIAPCPEYMVSAAVFNLKKANTPQTNAISTLIWAAG